MEKEMTEKELIRIFDAVDMLDLPEKMLPIVLSNSEQRNDIYRKLLYINNYDVSKDWFQDIFEQRMSERKDKKQDFTPSSVSVLASSITGTKDGSFYEPTAGNGSMIIADWWRKAQLHVPFDFFPSKNYIECWELSHRSIPFLLLNLSIRGIVGTVHHGDVLEKKEYATYILSNPKDDCLGFSIIQKI